MRILSLEESTDSELNFENIKSGEAKVQDNINYVLSLDIIECKTDWKSGLISVSSSSKYKFSVKLWDNNKKKFRKKSKE